MQLSHPAARSGRSLSFPALVGSDLGQERVALSLDTRRLERFELSEHRHYGEPWRGAEGFSLQLTRSQRLLGGDIRPFRREG